MINWTTEEQAKVAAEKGLIKALNHSIKHHEQNRDCRYKDLIEKTNHPLSLIGGELCALCKLMKKLGKCCLNKNCAPGAPVGCCPEWQAIKCTWFLFCADLSRANYKVFIAAEAEMVKRLERELEKAKGEVKKEEPKLEHGDYGELQNVGWIKIHNEVFWLTTSRKEISQLADSYFIDSQAGNLLEVLKRNSEGLREFEVESSCRKILSISLDEFSKTIDFVFPIDGDFLTTKCLSFFLPRAIEIHQKLGQEIATLIREQKKEQDKK